MRCCATCRGHRSPHWHRSRFSSQRRGPSRWATFEGKSPGVGRTGWVCGGRRESVHGVLAAASMRLTPLRSPPARPRTVSVCVHHGKEREDQKRKRIASLCIHAWRGSTVSTKVDTHRQSRLTHRHRETVGGGAVWGSRTVGAMDGAIEPPGTGLRRVLQPHTAPPNPQQSRAALALALALASAGAGLQALQSNYVTQPAITSRARTASHSSSIRHTRLIASRRSGNRCHTGSNPASV